MVLILLSRCQFSSNVHLFLFFLRFLIIFLQNVDQQVPVWCKFAANLHPLYATLMLVLMLVYSLVLV